jgi:hypothetical protein
MAVDGGGCCAATPGELLCAVGGMLVRAGLTSFSNLRLEGLSTQSGAYGRLNR